MFKKLFLIFIIVFLCKVSYSKDLNIFRSKTYNLELTEHLVQSGETYTEYFDIDDVRSHIPDLILSTIETGLWIDNLPTTVFVQTGETTDKLIEYWGLSFASVKHGKVTFVRNIINNDKIDRNSYSWNLKLICNYCKIE